MSPFHSVYQTVALNQYMYIQHVTKLNIHDIYLVINTKKTINCVYIPDMI